MTRRNRFSLQGAVALLTGAASGLGRALLRDLQRRGARVAALDVDETALRELEDELPPGSATFMGDVVDAAAMAVIVEEVVSRFGRLDLLILNAGIEHVGAVGETEPAAFTRVVSVNLLGAYNVLKPGLAPVVSARGHVLAICSVSALLPWPLAASYGASKAGLESLMRSVHFEVEGSGASCGTAYLGFVDTPMARRAFAAPGVAEMLARTPSVLLGLLPAARAEDVARALLDAVEKRKTRQFIPARVGATFLLRGVYPLFDSFFARRAKRTGGRAKP